MEQRFFLGESSIKELIPILQEYTPVRGTERSV